MQLAAALQPLASLKQFVLCRIDPAPKPDAPWKTNKVPLDPAGFMPGDAQSPKTWLDAETAFTLANRAGGNYAVGFVITEQDPVWCLDIDDCSVRDANDQHVAWTPEALTLCAAFPGAAIEVSDSGRGLHIWGCGRAPEHAKKRGNLEFYTERRFIALGRAAQASGTVSMDWTPTGRLEWLVTNYFPPAANDGAAGGHLGDLSTEPDPRYRGPANDAELLRRALKSQGAASKLGHGASFADLWDCNVEVLARVFPSGTGDVFGRSEADAALASHLSFWTGAHGERIERLMRQSKLVRDKWDDNPGYLRRTINAVCMEGRDVLIDKEVSAVTEVPLTEGSFPSGIRPVDGPTLLDGTQQMKLFAGYTVVNSPLGVLCPNGTLRTPKQFRAHLGGFTFMMDPANTRSTRDAWEALTESQLFRAPRADATTFQPNLPFGTLLRVDALTFVNDYWPLNSPRKAGDATIFLEHMAKLFPNENDRQIVLCYMAAIVQHQGHKFQWAPLIQGVEGNGKSTLSRCVAYAVGQRYTHWPKASKLSAKFNGWMPRKVFYAVEDIFTPTATRDEIFEELKPMITGENLEIEGKGVDQVMLNIVGNFLFNSNHKDALRKTENDRRLAIFYTPQQQKSDLARDGMTKAYFIRMRRWLEKEDGYAIVSNLLHTHPIPDELNPAVGSIIAPDTSSTAEAIEHGLGNVEQEILERIAEGQVGFKGGYISSHHLDLLLEQLRMTRSIPRNRRAKLLKALGYAPHPHLTEGRTGRAVTPDGKRVTLYIREGHSDLSLHGIDVERAYETAQTAPRDTSTIPFGQPTVTISKPH